MDFKFYMISLEMTASYFISYTITINVTNGILLTSGAYELPMKLIFCSLAFGF